MKFNFTETGVGYADGTGAYEKGYYAAAPSSIIGDGAPDEGPFKAESQAYSAAMELARREQIQLITDAVADAMEDYLENGELRPHNPAIMHTHDAGPYSGYYYGSALHAEDAGDDIIMKLDDGFGTWTPESTDDIQVCAAGVAAGLAETITE